MPVFIVDSYGIIGNMNHAASIMLNYDTAPGAQYYGEKDTDKIIFINEFPWLKNFFMDFTNGDKNKKSFKRAISDRNQHFFISFSQSLDVSGKFSDTIVIIEDITKRKNMGKRIGKTCDNRSFNRFQKIEGLFLNYLSKS